MLHGTGYQRPIQIDFVCGLNFSNISYTVNRRHFLIVRNKLLYCYIKFQAPKGKKFPVKKYLKDLKIKINSYPNSAFIEGQLNKYPSEYLLISVAIAGLE